MFHSRIAAIAAILLAASALFAADGRPPHQARSVHLWYDAPESAAFYNEVTVQQSTHGSYFQVCGFSQGYFGVQEQSNGNKVVIFSVWDPGDQNNPNVVAQDHRVENLQQGDDVLVKRFGGEGTGAQSFYKLDWKLNTTYRFCLRASTADKKTTYSAYIFLNDVNAWKLLATFRTRSKGQLIRGYYSFIEDFRRDGKSLTETRHATYTNGWVETAKDHWQPLLTAHFTADNTQVDNYNAGLADGGFFLETGGAVVNKLKLNSAMKRSDTPTNHPEIPPATAPNP